MGLSSISYASVMFQIKKSDHLSGEITISGSKNAVLPIMAAALLIKGKVTLSGVPRIGDVMTYLDILSSLGVVYHFDDDVLVLDSTTLHHADFDLENMKKIRVSILLLAPLLYRLSEISIPTPGGCNLGARSIQSHLDGLQSIGYNVHMHPESISLDGTLKKGDMTIDAGFGVTPTENLIVANVLRPGKTTILLSAIEPHVMNLIDFLRTAGANISIRYDHTIIIEGVSELRSDIHCDIVADYIQSGTYMILAALAAKDSLTIHNARCADLYIFMKKLKEAGVRIEICGEDSVRVYRCHEILPVSIQTNIFPGFPTDLQSPFIVLMTQAGGESHMHEILFEARLGWTIELEKMGANVDVINRHECSIGGKTELTGTSVASWDLRAGAAMVIAGIIADGTTMVHDVAYIHRGYDQLVANLKSLGADIEEI